MVVINSQRSLLTMTSRDRVSFFLFFLDIPNPNPPLSLCNPPP